MLYEHGHGRCTAPNTKYPYWQDTFCELDNAKAQPIVLCDACKESLKNGGKGHCMACFYHNLDTFVEED